MQMKSLASLGDPQFSIVCMQGVTQTEESNMYIIYHIPGEKVGCTANLDSRKRDYREGTEFEILDLISDGLWARICG